MQLWDRGSPDAVGRPRCLRGMRAVVNKTVVECCRNADSPSGTKKIRAFNFLAIEMASLATHTGIVVSVHVASRPWPLSWTATDRSTFSPRRSYPG